MSLPALNSRACKAASAASNCAVLLAVRSASLGPDRIGGGGVAPIIDICAGVRFRADVETRAGVDDRVAVEDRAGGTDARAGIDVRTGAGAGAGGGVGAAWAAGSPSAQLAFPPPWPLTLGVADRVGLVAAAKITGGCSALDCGTSVDLAAGP